MNPIRGAGGEGQTECFCEGRLLRVPVFIFVRFVSCQIAKEDSGHHVGLVGCDETGTDFVDWGCVNFLVDGLTECFQFFIGCGWSCFSHVKHGNMVQRFVKWSVNKKEGGKV